MRKNKWSTYFIYAIVLQSYIVLSNQLLIVVEKQREMTYTILPSILWSMIVFIGLGVLLGLEKLLIEIRKVGTWKIDLPKVIFLGIPALYFSFGIFSYFLPASFLQQILSYPIQIFIKGDFNFLSIFQIILGYIMSTSFIKLKN